MADPLPCLQQEGVLLAVVAGQQGRAADDVPATGLIERDDVAQAQLHYDAPARDPHPGRLPALEGKGVFKPGGVGVTGGKAQHIDIVVALAVDADDFLHRLALNAGDLLQIQCIFPLVQDRDLRHNGLGERSKIQVAGALVDGLLQLLQVSCERVVVDDQGAVCGDQFPYPGEPMGFQRAL